MNIYSFKFNFAWKMIIRFLIKCILLCIISVSKSINLRKTFAATEFLRYFAAKTDITLFDDVYTFSV